MLQTQETGDFMPQNWETSYAFKPASIVPRVPIPQYVDCHKRPVVIDQVDRLTLPDVTHHLQDVMYREFHILGPGLFHCWKFTFTDSTVATVNYG